MKAARLHKNTNCLTIEEMETPIPQENDVLVKVKACGVCHTDLHYLDHGIKTFKEPPLILGHEASGVIAQKGDNENNYQIGDRVMIPSILNCGVCFNCESEKTNICNNMQMPGNHIDGGYAEYICINSKHLSKIPDEVSFEEAALASDALSTGYHAVFNRAKVKQSDNVVIFGAGGVGLSVLLMSKLKGATVVIIDNNDARLVIAKETGADFVINNTSDDCKQKLKEFFGGKIDCIFEAVGNKSLIEQSISLANPGTKVVLVGYNKDKVLFNSAKTMFYELDILGSLGCRYKDYSVVMDLIKDKQIDPSPLISFRYNLEDINIAFDNLRQSKGIRSFIVFE